jgi:hypothetical protein
MDAAHGEFPCAWIVDVQTAAQSGGVRTVNRSYAEMEESIPLARDGGANGHETEDCLVKCDSD